MTHTEARVLITNIKFASESNHIELTWSDLNIIAGIRARFASGSKITKQESMELQEIYKHAAGGGLKTHSIKLSEMITRKE